MKRLCPLKCAESLSALLVLCLLSCTVSFPPSEENKSSGPGPLRVCKANPRYFTDKSGKPILLAGSHTWANLQEIYGVTPRVFDFEAYLDFLQAHNLNFMRLWTWEHSAGASWAPDTATILFGPTCIYSRTGPGTALDGGPRFDLTRFNQAHFDRLRSRVAEAGRRGIYVMVMLFQGFSIEKKGDARNDPQRGNPWLGHPFNRANNINGIDGDLNGDNQGEETHNLAIPAVTGLQKAYIRKVADTVGDLDNVLYEISNESNRNATAWQYEMINCIHEYEKTKTNCHPVVMTFQYEGGNNRELFDSPAEAISPNPGENEAYRRDPPPSDGGKVILSDTDHLWGLGGNAAWVWKSFTRGLNPMLMDPMLQMNYYPFPADDESLTGTDWEAIRRNLGYIRAFSLKLDLAAALPRVDLASSGYCLAKPTAGHGEYLVYLPEGGTVEVDLTATPGPLVVEWFDPRFGTTADTWNDLGGGRKAFTAPFPGHAVLYIHGA